MSKNSENEYPNGYTPVPNELFDVVMISLTPVQWTIYCYILRKTIGWQKDKDKISFNQITKGTGLSRMACVENTHQLVTDNWIICNHSKRGQLPVNEYRINMQHPVLVNIRNQYTGCTSTPDVPVPSTPDVPVSPQTSTPDVLTKERSKETIKERSPLVDQDPIDNSEKVDKPDVVVALPDSKIPRANKVKIIQQKLLYKYKSQLTAEPAYASISRLLDAVGDNDELDGLQIILNAIERMPMELEKPQKVVNLVKLWVDNPTWGTNNGGDGKQQKVSFEDLSTEEQIAYYKDYLKRYREAAGWEDPKEIAYYENKIKELEGMR